MMRRGQKSPYNATGKVVWNDGEQTQHRINAERVITLPRYLRVIEPNADITKAMKLGAGTPFVLSKPMAVKVERDRRIAAVVVKGRNKRSPQIFEPGTLAIYVQTVRSPERRRGVEVQAWRHIFLIGSFRCIILDVNLLIPT
jgi:hypothetical protein